MSLPESDVIIVRCLPVVEGEDPPVPSVLAECLACGAAIWVSNNMMEQVSEQTADVQFYCHTGCLPPMPDNPATITPWQRKYLHSQGLTDSDIELALVLANMGDTIIMRSRDSQGSDGVT